MTFSRFFNSRKSKLLMAANSVRVAKQGLRKKIRRALAVMSEEQKREESELLVKKVDRANWEALITQYILPPFSCYVLKSISPVAEFLCS